MEGQFSHSAEIGGSTTIRAGNDVKTTRTWASFLAAAFLLSALGAGADAQTTTICPQLQTIFDAPGHVDAVMSAAKQSTTWLKHGCSTASFSRLARLKIWRALAFDQAGEPTAGAWQETIHVDGCGFTRNLNVLTVVRARQEMLSIVLAPGETRGDPTLQRDAATYVFAAVAARVPGCKDAYVDDTQVEPDRSRLPSLNPEKPGWGEEWTVVACGRPVVVVLTFTPDATGTTISAHAK